MKTQAKKPYFKAGQYHVCRFCETKLAQVKGSLLEPLPSKAHVTIVLENGILHRFNCCKDCAKNRVFLKDLQSIWLEDLEIFKQAEISQGIEQTQAEGIFCKLASLKVLENFCAVEMDLKDSDKALAKCRKKLQKEGII